MSDALFDLADFEETRPPAPVIFPPEMFACGIHKAHSTADQIAHGADCWHGSCPACGDPILGAYDVYINHVGAECGMCVSLQLRLNHLSYDIRNGRAPSERDLTVLDLGWRIGPEGSQIPPPGGAFQREWGRWWEDREGFRRWTEGAA